MPVRAAWRQAGWSVELAGRADGVRPDPEGAGQLVEELKSGSPDAQPDSLRGAFALQAACYARLLESCEGRPVRAELVWLGRGAAELAREPVAIPPRDVDRQLRRAVARAIAAAEAAEQDRALRRAAAASVGPAHARLRPGQQQAIDAVEHALAHGEQLLLEAPTGMGKTAVALEPALRHCLAEDRQLFVLTATRLQQQRALETLEAIAPRRLPTAVQLRAKLHACATGTLACHESLCAFARDYPERRDAAALPRAAFRAGPVLSGEALARLGGDTVLCPHALARDAARVAPVRVGDFNRAVDPVASLPELRDPEALRGAVLVVDEIHRLADRARQAASVALRESELRAALDWSCLSRTPRACDRRGLLEDALAFLRDTLDEAGATATGDAGLVEHDPPREPLTALAERAADLELAAWLEGPPALPGEAPDPFHAVCRTLAALAHAFEPPAPGMVGLVGHDGGEARLEAFCLDPAPQLRPLFANAHALIGLSGTLPPVELLADELGLDPVRRVHRRIASPFPAERRRVVIDASVATDLRSRTAHWPRLARRLAAFAEALPGSCLAVLPSFAALDALRAALPPLARRVVCQRASDADAERAALLAAVASGEPVLLLAVAGGALAEGVDYPRGRLAGVAVVGPCLPAPDSRRRLLAEHWERACDAGFEVAYALPGMLRVVQSAGRLIRAETDRGVIALFGRRFLREPFRSALPADWLAGREPEALRGDAAGVARAFFSAQASSSAKTT